MAYTYDFTSSSEDTVNIARVRLLVPDNRGETDAVFSDEEMGVFLDLEDDNVHFAAAQALDSIAVDNALLYKHIEVMDVIVNAVELAKELRYRAETLRKQGAAKLKWETVGIGDVKPFYDYVSQRNTGTGQV